MKTLVKIKTNVGFVWVYPSKVSQVVFENHIKDQFRVFLDLGKKKPSFTLYDGNDANEADRCANEAVAALNASLSHTVCAVKSF